ncbi:MAG: M23 family metallopeptidase [Ardenticatenia bacterium]|nr:M23 family metallopeptidase [Ardenticatenia bacterium]
MNDYYALDHPLKEWDIVYPPASGTVLYAGWAGGGWASLGRVVIIDLGGGYWAMAAHLRGINVHVGQHVWLSTVIGWAGRSGHYQDNYWPSVHLHQGLYKDAHLASWAGGIYGGHSAQPVKVHYFGNGGGDYWYIQPRQLMSW